MRVRVVVADRAQALFYDAEHPHTKLQLVAQLDDPQARLPDREYKSDRPGRVFDHAPSGGRRGAVAHHDTGGERSPRRHEAGAFARRIVDELEHAWNDHAFDRLVVVAGPKFLGDLRDAMSKPLSAAVALEIGKDLVHQGEVAIREHLPVDAFI